MDSRISLITLGVRDFQRSVQFYKDGLGLPFSKHSAGDVAFFELQGTWLSLFPRDQLAKDAQVSENCSSFSGITLAHNVKDKATVDEVMLQAEKAGATITKPAADTFWGGYSGYFKDPDGYLWEIAWNPHFDLTF